MKNHEGCIRGYHRTSKSYYAKSVNRMEINFGMFHKHGGTSGEMNIEWVELDGKLCAKLKCFEDGWSALSLFKDLIRKMGEVDSELIQEEDFAKMLDECGFEDMTAYKDPYENVKTPKTEMVNIEMPKEKAKKLGLLK